MHPFQLTAYIISKTQRIVRENLALAEPVQAKMTLDSDPDPWWHVLAEKNARQQAHKLAAVINQRPGGVQGLSYGEAMGVAKSAEAGVNIHYLEALTVPAAGSSGPPPNHGPSEPDTPEVAANLKRIENERKRAKLVAIVAADKASRGPDPDFTVTQSSRSLLPATVTVATASTDSSSSQHPIVRDDAPSTESTDASALQDTTQSGTASSTELLNPPPSQTRIHQEAVAVTEFADPSALQTPVHQETASVTRPADSSVLQSPTRQQAAPAIESVKTPAMQDLTHQGLAPAIESVNPSAMQDLTHQGPAPATETAQPLLVQSPTFSETAPGVDEGEITPIQETLGRRARRDSVRFIRERTNSRSASTTPTRANFPAAAAALPHTPTEPTATVPETRLGAVAEPTTSYGAETGDPIGIIPTSQDSEPISNVEQAKVEPSSPREGPSREEKGKWVVREPSANDMSSGSTTPTPSNTGFVADRNSLYRQARTTARRLALYEKAEATRIAKPTDTAPTTAPARTMANLAQPGSSSERQADPNAGFQGFPWTYATHTRADQQMLDLGLIIFEKLPTSYQPPPTEAVPDAEMLDRPIVVNQKFIMINAPAVHFDDLEDLTHVLPFVRVRPDARSVSAGHPDYLGPTPPMPGYMNMKLSQYQSCEMFGEEIWRHDRDLLKCRYEGCKVHLSDWNADQFLCLGCGPKSIVRYCSKQHMLNDKAHWVVCGSDDLLLKRIIDHNSEPSRFHQFCPAIVDRTGWKSPERHRQRNHAMLCAGHYTLFWATKWSDKTDDSKPYLTIQFPRTHPHYTELTARVERLLNLAFFDHLLRPVIDHLYRLLRHALQLSNLWNEAHEDALAGQLILEFLVTPAITADPRPLCDCEWVPRATDKHHAECILNAKNVHAAGELMPYTATGNGLAASVSQMESEYWVLRAWQQQSDTIYWRKRAEGEGFLGVTLPKVHPEPYLGRGCKCSLPQSVCLHVLHEWLIYLCSRGGTRRAGN